MGWTTALLLVALAASAAVQITMATLAARRWRSPAVIWALGPLLVWCAGWTGAALDAVAAGYPLGPAGPEEIVPLGVAAAAAAQSQEARVWLATGLALQAGAWLAALGHAVGAGRKARYAPIHATWVGLAAVASAFGLGCSGALASIPAEGAILALVTMSGASALGIAGVRRSRRPVDDQRLVAARGLVGASGALSIALVAAGLATLARAAALGELLTVAAADRPARAWEAAQGSGWVAVLGALAVLGLVVPTLVSIATAPRAIGTWRALAGALFAGVLALSSGAAPLAARGALAPLDAFRTGGKVGEQPDLRLSGLPLARDLGGKAELDGGLTGTCAAIEGVAGWELAPLFPGMDHAAQIARHDTVEEPIPELEWAPGCPEELAPLAGPFSMYERPLVVIGGDRMAATLTGTRWFLRSGDLGVLVAPDWAIHADDRADVRAWRFRTVPFHWETPPEWERVGDGDEAWDYEGAAMLPVTVLEGARPILLAGGSREVLPAGQEGAARLRDALLASDKRDLVLVPRKSWRVQDLVDLCLTALGHVEGARCVLRPETPERWSQRTGLPLPWESPEGSNR